MKSLTRLALAAALATGATAGVGVTAPANAGVSISLGLFGGGDYYDNRPCSYYRYHRIPAPHRCYDYYHRYYGRGVVIDGDFIFRDNDEFGRWRGRDEYRHWRNHEFRHDQWHRGDKHDQDSHSGQDRGDHRGQGNGY